MESTTNTIFLSHPGADTAAIAQLRPSVFDSGSFKAPGVSIWFGKADLKPGTTVSKRQIGRAIEGCDAFVMCIGAGGAMNRAEAKVRLGRSQAAKRKTPFVRLLSAHAAGSSAAPAFARQYHTVRNPLGDAQALKELAVARGCTTSAPPVPERHTSPGLNRMQEIQSNRFFGRTRRKQKLVEMLRRPRLVAIFAESGSGKPSITRTGVISRSRSGRDTSTDSTDPPQIVGHVMTKPPGDDPFSGLRCDVTAVPNLPWHKRTAAASLRKRIAPANPEELLCALRCDLPFKAVETLLLVNQAEGLVTQCKPEQASGDLDVLLELTGKPAKRVRALPACARPTDLFPLAAPHHHGISSGGPIRTGTDPDIQGTEE